MLLLQIVIPGNENNSLSVAAFSYAYCFQIKAIFSLGKEMRQG